MGAGRRGAERAGPHSFFFSGFEDGSFDESFEEDSFEDESFEDFFSSLACFSPFDSPDPEEPLDLP